MTNQDRLDAIKLRGARLIDALGPMGVLGTLLGRLACENLDVVEALLAKLERAAASQLQVER